MVLVSHPSAKFRGNLFGSFCEILLTNKPTNDINVWNRAEVMGINGKIGLQPLVQISFICQTHNDILEEIHCSSRLWPPSRYRVWIKIVIITRETRGFPGNWKQKLLNSHTQQLHNYYWSCQTARLDTEGFNCWQPRLSLSLSHARHFPLVIRLNPELWNEQLPKAHAACRRLVGFGG